MADDFVVPFDTTEVNDAEKPRGTVADFGKTLAAGAAGVGSNVAEMGRYFYEKGGSEDGAEIAKSIGALFGRMRDDATGSMNPESQKLAASTLTSAEFWEHPLLATALKTTGMVPGVIATAIPGGMFSSAMGATLAAAAAGGGLAAGAGVDDFYKKMDEASDDELAAQSPKFKVMLEAMGSEAARRRFTQQALGWKPAIDAVFGAALGAVGPAGTAARALTGNAKNAVVGAGERGALGSAGVATAEGALTNAAQEGASDYTAQTSEIDAGFADKMDPQRMLDRVLEGGYLGGVAGGAVGAAVGGKKSPKTIERLNTVLDAVDSAGDGPAATTTPQTKNGTTGAAAKPVETAAVGNPQNEPTRTGKANASKKKLTLKGKEPLQVVESTGPDAAQAAAIAQAAPPVLPTATEAAVAPPTVQAPPAVADASRRLAQSAPVDPNTPVDPAAGAPDIIPPIAETPSTVVPESPAGPVDTNMNVPERPETLQAQVEQLRAGQRAAVMFPGQDGVPARHLVKGLTTIKSPRGVIAYDPKRVSASQVLRASMKGRENEFLNLGSVPKDEAIARANAGETPVAVTERTPDGTEVRAAAGTDVTAPGQLAEMAPQKTPGNTMQVETPESVIAGRRAPRILPNLQTADIAPVDLNAVAKANLAALPKVDESGDKIIKGRNMGPKAREAVKAHADAAEKILAAHPPVEAEAHASIVERANSIVRQAVENDVKIPKQIKVSAKGDQISDQPSIQRLVLARDLVQASKKFKTGSRSAELAEKIEDFRIREAGILMGGENAKDTIAERRTTAEAATRRDQGSVEELAATQNNDLSKGAEEADTTQSLEDKPAAVGSNAIDNESATIRSKVTSGKGAVRGVDASQGAASEVRKVKVDPEKQRQMIEALARLEAKNKRNEGAYDPVASMREAAANVNLNPTPAQIEAGNYRKGHVTIQPGMDVTIETPKGELRRGVDANGKPWEAEVKAHYGYFKGTIGADGDHLDVFVGPATGSKARHFVVDQMDLRTGQFDEHKVMANFHNEQEALRAYRGSYTDGRGAERIGNVVELTTSELNAWRRSGETTKPITDLMSDFESGDIVSPYQNMHAAEAARALKSSTVADEIRAMRFEDLPGVNSVIAPYARSQLAKLAGNIPVHYLRATDLAKLGGTTLRENERGIFGVHVDYGNGNSQIYINADYHAQRGEIAQTLLHEAAHGATQREIDADPKARAVLGHMSDAVQEWTVYNRPDAWEKVANAFKNEHEFMAEAFSNAEFQDILSQIPADPELVQALGLGNKPKSAWEFVLGFVNKAIEKITGKIPGDTPTMLAAVLKQGGKLMRQHELGYPEHSVDRSAAARMRDSSPENMPRAMARDIVGDTLARAQRIVNDRRLVGEERAPRLMKLRGLDNIAQISDTYFGENNPVRRIQQAVERMRIYGQTLTEQAAPAINQMATLRAKHAGKTWDDFTTMMHDASIADVDPTRPLPPGSETLANAWGRAQHAELAEAYAALPSDLKAGYKMAIKHFGDLQRGKVELMLRNQLKDLGHEDPALLKRFMDGTTTEEDGTLLKGQLDILKEQRDQMMPGSTYVPLIRDGDFVVRGHVPLATPGGAKRISDNEFEFKTKAEALAYAKGSELQPTIRSVWVDEKTGELHFTDDNGAQVKALKEDVDSEQRFRVSVQNEHLEFHQTQAQALRRRQELVEEGLTMKMVEPKKYEPNGRQAAEVGDALYHLVKKTQKTQAYKDATPTQKAAMVQAIEEASVQARGSNRLTARNLPRRGVRGYNQDVVQHMYDYTSGSARYMAKLEHGPALDAAQKDMLSQLDRDASKTGQLARRTIANEVTSRVTANSVEEAPGKFAPVIKRAMALSFIDKLASPAYSMVNATQVAMITVPVAAARHGMQRTVLAMGKAYKDIGAGNVVKRGAVETVRKLKGNVEADDFIGGIMSRASITAGERLMIQHMRDTGYIDPSAGMEITGMKRDYGGVGGRIDKGIAYMEGVSREMPRAIEAINRSVTALGGYRLEIARGATHEQAVQYAGDLISKSQFNYSPSNNPKLFNHPLAKIAFQFKNYGRNMYQLLGDNIGRAIRPMEPGDRAEALKTLAGLVATHTAMAGALGLPTEPFKYLLMGANAVGLTDNTWGDVENKVRGAAANTFGKTAGEALTRGLPRLLGVDLGRMGLDSVTSFGEPRSAKEGDVKTWLFDNIAGPVAALGGDWVKGVGSLKDGDMLKAAEKLVPVKVFADSIRAYRQATEGKKSSSGNQSSEPYSPTEAGLRALGFTPGREAEESAKRSAYFSGSAKQKDAVASLTKAWVDAAPQGKAKAMAAITAFNKGVPKDSQITMKMLTAKLKSREKNATEGELGVVASKRDKRFMTNDVYNTR